MIKRMRKIVFALAIFLVALVNVNALTCTNPSVDSSNSKYENYYDQGNWYCIDWGFGDLKDKGSVGEVQEITGDILKWAEKYSGRSAQIAYRLIAIENGYTRKDTASNAPADWKECMMQGAYEDAEFKAVYNDWVNQPNKSIDLGTMENTVFLTVESINKTETSFTAIVNVSGNGKNPITLTTNTSGVTISPATVTGSGKVTVTGPVSKDCDGPGSTVTIYAIESKETGGTEVPPTYQPGSCTNTTTTRWFYVPGTSLQGYIIPVKVGEPIPGCKWNPGTIKPGQKTPGTIQNYSGKVEIDASPEGCNADCSADISQSFACGGEKVTTTYLHETKNILGCIVKGKYKDADNCNSSIRKTNNADKEPVLTINGGSQGVNIATSNKYCKVFCIEKIDYKLPGEIKVNNGTYFTMADGMQGDKIKLEGTRTCYTSKIDNVLYARNIRDQQKKVVTAFNAYLKNKAYADNSESLAGYEKTEEKCEVKSCTQQKTKDPVTGAETTTDVPSAASSSTSFYTYTKKFTYVKHICTYDTSSGQATCNPTNVNGTITVSDEKSGDATTADCGGTPIYTSCPTVSKTADKVLEEKHKEYVEQYQTNLAKAKTLSENEKQIIGEYKSCFKWNNNYCFNPKIRFEYEDGEIYTDVNKNNYLTGTTAEAKSKKTGDVTAEYEDQKSYYADVDNEYNGAGGGSNETSVNYVYITGEQFDLKQAQVDYTNHFVKSESKKSSTFEKSSVRVCTYYPYGTISTGDSCNDDKNRILLGHNDNRISEENKGYVFPVTLEKRENRKYNYYLYFENIGVAGDDASCASAQTNRLMGCKNATDIYTKYTTKKEDKYKCEYSSCPNCPSECKCPEGSKNCHEEKNGEDTICVFDTPSCPDCPVECIGCLWSHDNSTFAYEQVSLTKVFPNENANKAEKVGYNWNTNPEVNPNAEKAEETIKEIQKTKEEAYDSKPQYSYTLTPSVMAKIREYNAASNQKEATSVSGFGSVPQGGYNNDTLTCEKGLSCKSSFLDSSAIKAVENARNKNWDNNTFNSAWR